MSVDFLKKIIIIFNLSLHLLQNSDNRHLEIYLQVLNSFKLGMTFIRLFSLPAHNWIWRYNTVLTAQSEFTSHPLLTLGSTCASAGKRVKQEWSPYLGSLSGASSLTPRAAEAQLWQVRRLHLITNGITTTMEFFQGNIFFFIIVISKYWTCFSTLTFFFFISQKEMKHAHVLATSIEGFISVSSDWSPFIRRSLQVWLRL